MTDEQAIALLRVAMWVAVLVTGLTTSAVLV